MTIATRPYCDDALGRLLYGSAPARVSLAETQRRVVDLELELELARQYASNLERAIRRLERNSYRD